MGMFFSTAAGIPNTNYNQPEFADVDASNKPSPLASGQMALQLMVKGLNHLLFLQQEHMKRLQMWK